MNTTDFCSNTVTNCLAILPREQVSLQDPRNSDLAPKMKALNVDRNRIEVRDLLHEGTFGRVYRGSFKNQEVLVKTVSGQSSDRFSR